MTGSPAERHRRFAATFADRVAGATDWSAPTPVPEWTTRDVLRHLVDWFPEFLAAGSGHRIEGGPSVDVDPVGAWLHQTDAVQVLLDDPASASGPFEHPHLPALRLEQAIDRFYVADVFMHTWDLAIATGQDSRLDPDTCAEMFEGMLPMDRMLRESGQYGPAVEVPADADAQSRLLGFIGRDPDWTPPENS